MSKRYQVKLPCRVEVDDYHEFRYMQSHFNQLIPGAKVIEIGCAPPNYLNRNCHVYHGVVYVGNKTDRAVQMLIKNIKEEERKFSDEFSS